eukprot:6013475-Lingulodinium_polyedra.AAC.1
MLPCVHFLDCASARAKDKWTQTQTSARTQIGHRCSQFGSKMAVLYKTSVNTCVSKERGARSI